MRHVHVIESDMTGTIRVSASPDTSSRNSKRWSSGYTALTFFQASSGADVEATSRIAKEKKLLRVLHSLHSESACREADAYFKADAKFIYGC